MLPKAGKIKFFNYLKIKTLIRKSNRPNQENQEIAKSWKNQMFNYFFNSKIISKSNHQNQRYWQRLSNFLINISIAKSNHQNQEIAKTKKN